ncbi:class I SAM-dependent methyltransferase [Kitasatospora sp. NPDC088783]|uniref:class I SAM-dependent methyltransferase n=1 Tax=Kitasatospora sp. NPDC088783 TaxID=3364077 RepID=UPI0038009E91
MADVTGIADVADVADVQQGTLGHVTVRISAEDATGTVPAGSDARALPLPDGAFDAAHLVTAPDEFPDPGVPLPEPGRVVRPGGRAVVGGCFDRHRVRRTVPVSSRTRSRPLDRWVRPPVSSR